MKKKIILLVVLLLNFILLSTTVSIEAASAYYTYTVDRNGDLAETNEAYEAVEMIRNLSDGTTLSSAKDLFIDNEDYMYIADTGNKRVVILNPTMRLFLALAKTSLSNL